MYADYNALAQRASNYINVFALNGKDFNDIAKALGVKGFPTIFYVDKLGHIGSEFNQNRTTSNMVKFVCSNWTDSVRDFCGGGL